VSDVTELIERGVLAYVTGKIPDAVAVFQEVLALEPDNAKARGYLILVQATHPELASAPPPPRPAAAPAPPPAPRSLPPAPAPPEPAARRTLEVAPPPPPPPPEPPHLEPAEPAAPPVEPMRFGAKLRLPAPPKPKKRSLPFDLDSDAFVKPLTTKSPMAPKDLDAAPQEPPAPALEPPPAPEPDPFAAEPAASPFAEPAGERVPHPLEAILFAPTPPPVAPPPEEPPFMAEPHDAPSDTSPFFDPGPAPEPPAAAPDRFVEPPVRAPAYPTPMMPMPAAAAHADDPEYAPSPWDDGPSGATIVLADEPSGGLDLAAVAEKSDLRPLVPEGTQPAPGPAHGPPTDVELWLKAAKELFALGDFTGSLELIEKILTVDPDHGEARDYLRQNEATLVSMYESKLGPLHATPRLAIKPEEVMWLNLDHRAGFLLAQIDGSVDYEGLFALSGLPRLDTARILANLIADGVVKS